MTEPVVSVCMISFNHARYVAEALRSALAQRCPFPFEVVISDDASSDGTVEAITAIAAGDPRVRPHFRQRNVGMMRNLIATYAACSGRYIALLEGDDRWTDPEKLARQVALMESDTSCAVCYHDVRTIGPDGLVIAPTTSPRHEPSVSTVARLLSGNFIQTCSALYRHLPQGLPADLAGLSVGDWPSHVLHAVNGRIRYLARTMADYRLHGGGVWTSAAEERRRLVTIDAARCLRRIVPAEHRSGLAAYERRLLFAVSAAAKDPSLARRAWLRSVASLRRDRGMGRCRALSWSRAQIAMRSCRIALSRARAPG